MVIGTDLPLSDRQLKRVAKRAVVGLARVGSFLGNGSGDIAIAFSNGNIIPHYSEEDILETKMLHDNAMDKIFEGTAEAVEEAVISSLYHAGTVKGFAARLSADSVNICRTNDQPVSMTWAGRFVRVFLFRSFCLYIQLNGYFPGGQSFHLAGFASLQIFDDESAVFVDIDGAGFDGIIA